jgi:NitT/TauT family transport system ATP-binding protein
VDNHLSVPLQSRDSCLQGERPEVVRLERVGFHYGNSPTSSVLEDVSLEIGERDTMAIVGKSGVGKSTLLRIIGRSLLPTAGAAYHSPAACRPGAIAYMDQASTLFPWKRASQIIALSLSRSLTGGVSRPEVERALAAFGLEGTYEKFPHELSGGMRQRLALAFSMLRQPALLLLDEPFGSVDEFTREKLYSLLGTTLIRKTTAVVIITHSTSECLTLADRVIVLGGRPMATVAGEFAVRGPKPRSASTLLNGDFVALNKEIRRTIGDN